MAGSEILASFGVINQQALAMLPSGRLLSVPALWRVSRTCRRLRFAELLALPEFGSIHLMRRVSLLLIAAAAILLLSFAYHFLTFNSYVDHGVPVVIARSWTLLQGIPLYQAPESEDYLFLHYGPVIFYINAVFLHLFGGTLLASKLGGVVSAGLAALVFLIYVWREFGAKWAGLGMLLFVCLQLYSVPFTVWGRPDPHAVLLVSLALLATTMRRDNGNELFVAICIGVLSGIAINLKAHFFIFFVPLVFRFCLRGWRVNFPVIIATSAATALLPFGLPGMTLTDYLNSVFKLVGVRDILFNFLWEVTKRSWVYLSPMIALVALVIWRWRDLDKRDLLYFGVLTALIFLSFYPSMVAGSGWYQMNPFFPITVDIALRFFRHLAPVPRVRVVVIGIFVIGFGILSVTPQKRHYRMFNEKVWMADVVDEIHAIEAELRPAKVQLGYGFSQTEEAYRLSWLKTLLVFKGHPITIDAWSDGEAKFSNVPVEPYKTLYLTSCDTEYWLIPKSIAEPGVSGIPFSMNSFHGGTVFWTELIEAFMWNHNKIRSYRYFDLWRCGSVG